MSGDKGESYTGSQREAYATEGAKKFLHGNDYQLKLLMLFAWEALNGGNYEVDFRLATEMKDSVWDAFDDLVFRYSQDGKKYYRYLQAKHCYFGDRKIKINDFVSLKNHDDFSLQKYFKSYLIIEQKLQDDENLKDVIICTNMEFDFKDFSKKGWIDFFEEKEDEDPVLNLKKGKIYKFKQSEIVEVKKVLEPIFEKALQERKGVSEVEEEEEGSKPKKRRQMTFLDDLLGLAGIENRTTLLNECLYKMGDFLEKLVFAVEQPSGAELDKIIKKNIGAQFNLINSCIYNDFHKYMYDWMKDYRKNENNKNVACFLTRDDLKKFFDDAETKIASLSIMSSNLLYKGKIDEYGINFKDDIEEMENIKNFVITREEQLLMIYQSKPLLTGIKVCQVLSNMKTKHYKQDEYICSDLKSLSILKGSSSDPIKMFKSLSRNLAIIEHNTRGKEIILNSFFNVLVNNPEKKIIIITSEEQKGNIEYVLDEWLEELADDEKIKWTMLEDRSNKLTDLTDESQTMLLNKGGTVIFQGNVVSLFTLMLENKKHLVSGEVLFKVINDEKIDIGPELEDQKYNEIKKFYMGRKFSPSVNRDKDIENEKSKLSIIYDIESDSDTSDREIEVVESSLEPDSIEDKVVIIVADPGAGKSTILSHIAQQKKESQPSLMIIKVNLLNYSTEFRKLMECNGEEELFKFLYRIFLNNSKEPESKLQENLNLDSLKINLKDNKLSCTKGKECKLDDVSWFKIQLFNEYYNKDKVFFMFDGYDEICPDYKAKVMELFKVLNNSKATIWISSRPYNIIENLENELGVSSYTLLPISEDDKKVYLKKFWGFDDERSDRFVQTLLRPNYMKDFTSNPLQLHMFAVVLKGTFKECYNSDKEMLDYNEFYKLILSDFSSLYKEFVKIKFHEIHIKEKVPGLDSDRLTDKELIKNSYKTYLEDHKKLAVYSLLKESDVGLLLTEQEWKLDIPKKIEEIKGAEEKTGIISHVADNKPIFVHQTFAEYFLSVLIYDKLVSGADYKVCKFFLEEILVDDKFEVVRRFLSSLLKGYKINNKTSENIMKALENILAYKSSLFNCLRSLLDFKNTTEELKEMVKCFQKNHTNWLENIPTSIKSELESSIASIITDENKTADFIEILDSFRQNKQDWLEYIFLDDKKRDIMTKILKKICYRYLYRKLPLFDATWEDLDVIVEFLLEKHPDQIIKSYNQLRKKFINFANEYYYTGLDSAVEHGNKNLVRLLLRNGALITPEVIICSKEEIYQILLEYFSSDNVIVPSNHLSKYFPKLDLSISEVNEQIEKHGINHQDKYGDTLLHKALQGYNYELAALLINKGADINIKNSIQHTALSFAVIKFGHLIKYFPFLYDCPECNPPSEDLAVESLIREPSPITSIIQNISGQTFASKTIKQTARICKLLFDKGADENELKDEIEKLFDWIAARMKLTPSNIPVICMTCKRETYL